DLSGMWNRRDESERPIRLIDTHTVIGLNAIQVEVNQLYGCNLFRLDGILNTNDARLFQMEFRSWRLFSIREGGRDSKCNQRDGENRPFNLLSWYAHKAPFQKP